MGSADRTERMRRGGRLPRGTEAPARTAFPELLAPAGSVESYFAAVSAGADAVYLGLQRFNARERAENFSLAELCRILPHAQKRGIRVYLAMNTVLTEADLPEAISLLHQVAPLSPDALIVTDLGLMRILRDHFPQMAFHVSTQTGCASVFAAEAFAALGAERVILERHLDFSEVRRIVSTARVGVEIFVHGAMCYSFSGKCFFSSFLGGKSGNRGACVQPCRRLYGHPGGEEAVFSTHDLSLIDLLPELVPLGFAAFKIEGRMRSAEYVSGVVSAYRRALDRIREGRGPEAVAEGKALLERVIGRGETPGLTGGAAPAAVVAGGLTGNVGELVGPIREIRDGWAHVPGDAPVVRGDRLRVQFQIDGSGKGFTALAMRADAEGLYVRVPFDVSPGDLLFRVGGGGRAEITRSAKRELAALPPGGVRFRVFVGEGIVVVEASYGKMHREYSFRVSGTGLHRGGRIPPDASDLLRAAYRSDLPAGEIRVEGTGATVAWQDVTDLFLKAARKFDKEFYLSGKDLRLTILPTLRVSGSRRETLPTLFFAGCRAEQLGLLPRVPEIVPVVEFTRSLARDPFPGGRGFRERAFFRLPPPLLESDAAFLKRTVREAVAKGHRRWVVSDAGHFRLFAGFDLRRHVTLVSDHYLYAFNTGALSTLSRLGASRMILPAEANLPALRAVGKYLHDLGIAMAYGAVPLMISRLLPSSGVRGEVTSPRGERFRIEADERGSTVFSAQPFSASGFLDEIRAAGIRDFYADLRDVPDGEIGQVLSALFADRPIPGTSTFNLLRENF
ncbi:MAG TPA: U32 family peptidase [Candidatus Deferrimicrobiaceae bacterium]|nr:U32 family peptidase [Candidatus Deferrimicrobiaceae bacterium]